MYRIVIDRHIPFLEGVFDPFAEVVRLPPEEITAAAVRDADVLVVRTRTRCDAALLEGSRVRLIATATIGYDHIDTDYCRRRGIEWTACPGCNAQAVCDYVEEALRWCEEMTGRRLRSIGIVGVGHVGGKVERMAMRRGMKVLTCDPFRMDKSFLHSPMEAVAGCDVITFHTPLTHSGGYPTYRLCDESFLSLCGKDTLVINAARGGIVDEEALLASGRPCVMDCWEREPDIRKDLLFSANTLLASFHIAGYSAQGKRNASMVCAEAVFRWAGIDGKPELAYNSVPAGDSSPGWIKRVTDRLRENPAGFETLRKNYVLR